MIFMNRHTIEYINKDDINAKVVGQKAVGLYNIPPKWTLPFFVISKDLYIETYNISKDECINQIKLYFSNIKKCFALLGINENDFVIVRSSGIKEGMTERGMYESIPGKSTEILNVLFELILRLRVCDDLNSEGIPLIVQIYNLGKITGHISNERRFNKDYRDFKYECYYQNNEFFSDNISLRNWRKVYILDEKINSELYCTNEIFLKDLLKEVCAFYYYHKKRVHIEFLWDGNCIYLVQADNETINYESVNPLDYDIKMFEKEEKFEPTILRKIKESDKDKYNKIKNVFIYKEVGIKTHPLYILDNNSAIEELRQGRIIKGLSEDIKYLVQKSLVIRTNIVSKSKQEKQLSNRSNELKTYEKACEWLINASKNLINKEYVFIFHNFIPAISSAFVNAKPLDRIVEMQSLWGLPEGLYYNTHDRITVDTKCLDYKKMDTNLFSIRKRESYKSTFISPNEDGSWSAKRIAQPYDWICSLRSDDTIKRIAYDARQIAEHVGEELSIMWFIDIDKQYYGVDNMPWYHEEYDLKNYTNNNFKKKYFDEKELIIHSEKDLITLEEMNKRDIGYVKIHPLNDEELRSKDFINKIGVLCKNKGVTILLEGAVLAHSFYQLLKTGANVVVFQEFKTFDGQIEFNKLVRDKIPDKIRNNGEVVKYGFVKGENYINALIDKLIEESYEVFDAIDYESIIEELADIEEICLAIENTINNKILKKRMLHVFDYKSSSNEKILNLILNNDLNLICGEEQTIINISEKYGLKFSIEAQRNKSELAIEINFIDVKYNDNKFSAEIELNEIDNLKNDIITYTSKIYTSRDPEEIIILINNIRNAREKIFNITEFSENDFIKILNKKSDRNGKFEKGYILLDTKFNCSKDTTENDDVLYIKVNNKCNKEASEIKHLKKEHKSYIDLIENEKKRLLLRVSFPLYISSRIIKFKGNKVKQYFGKDCYVVLCLKRFNEKMYYDLKLVESPFEQIKLDI